MRVASISSIADTKPDGAEDSLGRAPRKVAGPDYGFCQV